MFRSSAAVAAGVCSDDKGIGVGQLGVADRHASEAGPPTPERRASDFADSVGMLLVPTPNPVNHMRLLPVVAVGLSPRTIQRHDAGALLAVSAFVPTLAAELVPVVKALDATRDTNAARARSGVLLIPPAGPTPTTAEPSPIPLGS